jgi:hypothetical protein
MATHVDKPRTSERSSDPDLSAVNMCIDAILPAEKQAEAAQAAIAENPANVPVVHYRPGLGVGDVPVDELALLVAKQWQNGRTLRVRFLDGDPVVQQRLQPFAHEWSKHANVTFDFGDDPDAEIRISFKDRGRSWSNLGTDALVIPKNEPTMNYGWLTPNGPDLEYSRVVVHEFGHALGCIHEHQNPGAAIPWDKPAVYRYYAGPPNRWTKAMVDHNLFRRYSVEQTNSSEFDPASIMLYAISNDLTIGDWEVGWNSVLSQGDKTFIGSVYPKAETQTRSIPLDGTAVEADIGAHGELDTFSLTIPSAGRYQIETDGRTDVVMALFGPNSDTTLVAEDDDSGRSFNARIVAALQPGQYQVRVRHFRPSGRGAYTISARAVA